jgi:(p)ppGpp synthase/HD superfamily hydrolase
VETAHPAGRRAPAFSGRLDAALKLAVLAHEGQCRKGTSIPYAMHPFHVALILDRSGCAEDLVIAGLLHDVLEDMPFADPALRRRVSETFDGAIAAAVREPEDTYRARFERFVAGEFGPAVLRLVRAVTERKTEAGRPRPWRERRREQLAAADAAAPDELIVKAADALHNLASVAADLRRHGPRVMERFNAPVADTRRYFGALVGIVRARLPETGLVEELSQVHAEFERLLDAPGG